MELGKVQIFFGKVKSVTDEQKICRCQVAIPGLTDELKTDDLPWYFPWYGLRFLPVVDDTVPVLVFDENFSTAFYGNRLDLRELNQISLDGDDYEHYLELFKREIDGNDVQLTYIKSKGIQFINGKEDGSKGTVVHMELEAFTAWCEGNSIKMVKDKIEIGNKGLEAVIQGDKGCDQLKKMMDHMKTMTDNIYQCFQAIEQGASNPYCASIKSALSAVRPTTKAAIDGERSPVKSNIDTIQSKMVFTNE